MTTETTDKMTKKATGTGMTNAQKLAADPRMAKFMGMGTEHVDEGARTPFVQLFQAQSKAVLGGKEGVDGARPGMICIGDEIFDVAKKPLPFIALSERHVFVEWRSQDSGGGWVAEHAVNSSEVVKALALNGGKKSGLRTASGNDLVETFYMPILAFPHGVDLLNFSSAIPAVLSFSKTNLNAREEMMSNFRKQPGTRLPLFAAVMTLSSHLVAFKKVSAFNYLIRPLHSNFQVSLIDIDSPGAEAFFDHAAKMHEQYIASKAERLPDQANMPL